MKAVAIVVGIGHWKDITSPFLWSLREYNPDLQLVIVDNASAPPYPTDFPGGVTVRSQERVGYNRALNIGIEAVEADWYLCFNNDCKCNGPLSPVLDALFSGVVYGSGPNRDELNGIDFQWSAWLAISRETLEVVGLFDPDLSGGFEDFDYELRAKAAGFGLETAEFPVRHLDRHTRYEEARHEQRWEQSRQLFAKKHGLRTTPMPRPGWRQPGPEEWWRVIELGFDEYDIEMNRWRALKPFGISGCFRVCNDAEFLEEAVVSHLPWLDEAVLVLQPSDDGTEAIAERLEREYMKVRIVRYPMRPHFIDAPQFHADPVNSIRSFVFLSNWALAQCKYSWIAKIEADVVCLSSFGEVRKRVEAERDAWRYYGRLILNVAGRNRDRISKENPRNGGWDECVIPNHPDAVHFVKAEKWEVLTHALPQVCVGLSALHLKRCKVRYADGWNAETYLPLTPDGLLERLRQDAWPGQDEIGAALQSLWPEIQPVRMAA